ncbi:hypothetical protein ACSQ67_009930 [Phaseolus vulgaris]
MFYLATPCPHLRRKFRRKLRRNNPVRKRRISPPIRQVRSPPSRGRGRGRRRRVRVLPLHERGGCRDAFIGWEKCVQEAETNDDDLLEKCAHVTAALKQCMDAHSDYYEPLLRAEKLAEEQAIVELEKENVNSQQDQKSQYVEKMAVDIENIQARFCFSFFKAQTSSPLQPRGLLYT